MKERQINIYGDSWMLIGDLYWSVNPGVTYIFCGVTYEQLMQIQFMKKIGLKG